MLGLRTSPFKRTPSPSSVKPVHADQETMTQQTEEYASNGNGLTVTKRQHEVHTHTSSNNVHQTNGSQYHHTKGHRSSSHSSFENGDLITIIRDSVFSTRGRIFADFDHIDAALLDRMTIEGFSDYITRERLSSMPHRGSLWDRVLRWAEFYALQIAAYAETISPFVPESRNAAKQIFTLLRSLLELGEDNAGALNTTFGVFYKLGLSLSFLSSHEAKLSLSSHVREDVGRAFNDIHALVFDVALYYQRSVRGLSSGSVTLDFIGLFRVNLDNFYRRKNSIIEHMWRHSLGEKSTKEVQIVRKWLNQRSALLKAISTDRHTYTSQYDEFTCEWFQRHLLEFTRSSADVLAITAPAGCGKTILSSWIQERLQRPLDRKTYNTIAYSFEADIPRETTSLALTKSLTLQLLDLRVGNAGMFEAIVAAYNHKDPVAIENHLWAAMDAAFSQASEPTVLIVDGLDQLKGDSLLTISDRISKLAIKHTSLKAIILSRPNAALSANNKNWSLFDIKADDVYEDIRHVAKHALQSCEQFHVQKEAEQRAILAELVKAANGSFLWLLLTIHVLKKSKTIEEFSRYFKEAPKTLDEAINKYSGSIDFADIDIKLIFSLLLVTERPLTIGELYELLKVDIQHKTINNRQIDLESKIARTNGMLVVSDTKVVRFRHSAIRSYFVSVQREGKRVLSFNDAQADLTYRILIYSKAHLTKKHDISLEWLPHNEAELIYTRYELLEYAVRNWTYHFRLSSLFKPTGAFGFPAEFKAIFPSSSYMVLLEWTSWDTQTSKHDITSMHDLSLRVRSEIFEQKHHSTLQNVITCGFVNRQHSDAVLAANYFYRASRIGQAILTKFSKITTSCTELFLTITETIKFTSRIEIVTFREEMLKYIIIVHKHEHGETSDIVIRYYKALAELYISIHEEERAAEVWKELRIIIVKKYGEGSEAEREISGKLMIVLKGKKDFEIEPYSGDIFAIGEESTEVWDVARITLFLELALTYEARKEWYEAEEIYVTLWTRLLHLCKHQHSHEIEFRISVLRVAVEYAYFLQRRQRFEEAKNILIIIWTEHQHFGCDSMAFYLQLKVIGELMRTLGLLTISISVFEKIVQWFKAVGKYEHKEVHHCHGYILAIREEIIKQETVHHKEETTEEIEVVLRRIFSSTTVVTKEYLRITRTAVQLYIKKEQWSEAVVVLTKSLTLLWNNSFWRGEIYLPRTFVDEAIEFAIELGKCHMKLRHYHEGLSCYLQLWQVIRSSLEFHDKRRKVIIDILVGFYTEHKRWRLLIELHRDTLIEYRRHLGKSHQHTIEILYVIGALVLEHGHGYAEDYYREIIEVVGTTDYKISYKAYRVLCEIYYNESRWVQLKDVCDVLWKLLIHHHKEHDFDVGFVEILYIRYLYVLRYHHRSDHKLLVSIALQYKEICVAKFGSSSAIAVRARYQYASLLIESETTRSEAISVYEEIITISKTTKSVVDESTLTIIKKRLTEAYVYAHAHGSTSTTQIQRAIIVLQERYEHLKITLGYAHEETLAIFAQFILMQFKLKSTDYETTISTRLREIVIGSITKEQKSQVLFEAASAIGAIYIACGLQARGLELMREIRRQVIAAHTHTGKDGFKIDKSVGRISFVFLVAFELTLRGSVSHSYSEIMADWLTESILYENYNRCFTSQTKIDVLLVRSAHLRSFWGLHGRKEEMDNLERQVFEVFVKQYSTVLKTSAETIKLFLVSLLITLGSREAYNVQLATVASIAGNKRVLELIKAGRYQEAYEVGHCTFHFVLSQGGYHKVGIIGFGFKLSGYMAGRGAGAIPAELRAKMLHTSREIMAEVLHACKDLNINFAQLHDHELNDLIDLLGEQENYHELEIILESLWKSRHAQKHWSEDTLINLGARLIGSRHLADKDGHSHGAIHLAEDISYNLRRVLGGLNPHTLDISILLSQLYTSAKQYSDAINVHEEIIQLIVSGDDGDDRTIDVVSAKVARLHLDLLKAAFQRNERWVKSPSTYEALINRLLAMRQYKNAPEFKDVQPLSKWTPKKEEASPHLGVFVKPRKWEFIVESDIREVPIGKHVHSSAGQTPVRPPLAPKKQRESGWSLRKLSENWGMSFGGGGGAEFVDRARLVY